MTDFLSNLILKTKLKKEDFYTLILTFPFFIIATIVLYYTIRYYYLRFFVRKPKTIIGKIISLDDYYLNIEIKLDDKVYKFKPRISKNNVYKENDNIQVYYWYKPALSSNDSYVFSLDTEVPKAISMINGLDVSMLFILFLFMPFLVLLSYYYLGVYIFHILGYIDIYKKNYF